MAATRFFTAFCTFLNRPHLDLAHALAAHAEFPGEFVERDRVLGEPARFEDAPLAIVEHGDRRGERDAAVNELLARDEPRLLVGTLVDQPVLPLAEIAVLADRRVERGVAAEPAGASRRAMIFTWSGRISPSSRMEILLLALRRLKNSFFWLAVVPIFTSDHERRMYSWIEALIHHMA